MPHMEGVSKEVMIFLSSVATYNSSHQKFGVQFVTPDEQKIFVDLIAHRMNMLNPFDNPDIEYDFPLEFPRTGGNTHFESVKLGDLTEEKRIEWNLEDQVPEGDTFPFLQMCLGKYRNDRGQDTLLHARQHELLQPNHADDFNSPEELFAAMKEMPEDLEIFRAFQKTRPTNWDEGKYGAWCPRGAASRFFEISATPETSSTFLQ